MSAPPPCTCDTSGCDTCGNEVHAECVRVADQDITTCCECDRKCANGSGYFPQDHTPHSGCDIPDECREILVRRDAKPVDPRAESRLQPTGRKSAV